jgi:hypothetical protein
MTPNRLTTLRFPALSLPPSDSHRLRGYFGTAFRKHSPLLHNHLEDGETRQQYPLVQYKMIRRVPTIIGLNEGADTLVKLFADNSEIHIAEQVLDASERELTHDAITPAYLKDEMRYYHFETMYQGLNQRDYERFREASNDAARFSVVQRALTGHLLMFFKAMNVWLEPEQRIVAYPQLTPTLTTMKGTRVTAFTGGFLTNLALPDLIGIGKATSRGFGAIRSIPGGIASL